MFKSVIFSLSVFTLIGGWARGADEIVPQVKEGDFSAYKLIWHDEFDGSKLDIGQWDYRTGKNHWCDQKAENVSVKDGMLRIELKKEKSNGMEYTAGGVISKKTFLHGYIEACFRVPAGKGWHTSFWTAHHEGKAIGGRQEIDVCENDSINTKSYSHNLHQWQPTHKGQGGGRVKTPDLAKDFHVWGCEFTETEARYYFDGKLVGKTDATKFKHDEQSIWLTSIAADLGKTDKVDDSKLPAYAEYDYVRLFQKPGQDK